MGEATYMYSNLNDQQNFRFNRINGIKDYLIAKIRERELMSKKLSKYIAAFGYFDESSIVLSATSGSISIASFATFIGAPVRIASLIFSFAFSVTTGTIKKTRQRKIKKKNIIELLC